MKPGESDSESPSGTKDLCPNKSGVKKEYGGINVITCGFVSNHTHKFSPLLKQNTSASTVLKVDQVEQNINSFLTKRVLHYNTESEDCSV